MSANLASNFLFNFLEYYLFLLLESFFTYETSRQGNLFGIIGMTIAIGVTIILLGNFSLGFIYLLVFLLIGGTIGAFIAFRFQ